jgi:hypothetical protein
MTQNGVHLLIIDGAFLTPNPQPEP